MPERDYLRERFADDPQALQKLDRADREIEAQLAVMPPIDANTMAAIQKLRSEEARLD